MKQIDLHVDQHAATLDKGIALSKAGKPVDWCHLFTAVQPILGAVVQLLAWFKPKWSEALQKFIDAGSALCSLKAES